MKKCYFCGVGEDKAVLSEGIEKAQGIVSVCRKCFFKNKIPLVERKEIDNEKLNARESVRERLTRMARLNSAKAESVEDLNLKKLVEENFKKEIVSGKRFPDDLIDNYHWVVMRKRRLAGITKELLAEKIAEPLIAVEGLEKGILPRDYAQLVKKVENFLKINLYKKRSFDYNDIVASSKINSDVLIEELRRKNTEEKEKYLDVSNLNLEKVNEVYEAIEKLDEERNEKKSDDVTKLAWGK